MKNKRKRAGIIGILTIIFLILAVMGTIFTARWFENMKKADAQMILDLTQKNIEEVFLASQNEARLITEHIANNPDHTAQFQEIAQRSLNKNGISRVYLVKKNSVVDVVPLESNEAEIGKDLNQFPYIVNMAKLVQQTVVEGPLDFGNVKNSFLFIEPMLSGENYLGEVIVVADANYILETLNLPYFTEKGYDYELWRIDSQDGEKCVVAASDAQRDTSDAVRNVFYLPTEWTLEIEPSGGWISSRAWVLSVLIGVLIIFLFGSCCYVLVAKRDQKAKEMQMHNQDSETGILNQNGFIRELNDQLKYGLAAYTLIIFVMDEYIPLARVMEERQRKGYLDYVIAHLRDYVEMPHIYCRIGEGCYALAVLETLTENEAKDLAKELSLDLLWKTEVQDRRQYIHAKWSMLRYPEDGAEAAQMIEDGMKQFDEKFYQKRYNVSE